MGFFSAFKFVPEPDLVHEEGIAVEVEIGVDSGEGRKIGRCGKIGFRCVPDHGAGEFLYVQGRGLLVQLHEPAGDLRVVIELKALHLLDVVDVVSAPRLPQLYERRLVELLDHLIRNLEEVETDAAGLLIVRDEIDPGGGTDDVDAGGSSGAEAVRQILKVILVHAGIPVF